MAGHEARNFDVYLTHLANARMFRDQMITTGPAFAHVFSEAAEGAEQQAAELAADPLVHEDVFTRAEQELHTLQTLEQTRGYVSTETFETATKPLIERLQPMLDFILAHEIEDERVEAIKHSAVAVGAIALESIVQVVSTMDEASTMCAAEPTEAEVQSPATSLPEAGEAPAADDQPEESPALTTGQIRTMLLARLANIEEGTVFDPQVISAGLLGSMRTSKTSGQTRDIYHMLVASGALEHNGRRGPASRYTIVNKAALPRPDQQPQPATPAELQRSTEAFDADRILSVRDAQIFASILRRFSDRIAELGLPCPEPEVLDVLLEATPMQTQATNAADLMRERRDALQKIEAFLAEQHDVLTKFSQNLSELDARVHLLEYLQQLRAVSSENIPNLLSLLKKERKVIVITQRHVVVGTSEPTSASDTITLARRAAEEEAAPRPTATAHDDGPQSAESSPETGAEQLDPRLVKQCNDTIFQMIGRFLEAKLRLDQRHMPTTKLSGQLRLRYLSDKLAVAAGAGLIREEHQYADHDLYATVAEVIMAELYSKSHMRQLIDENPSYVGDLIMQELEQAQERLHASRGTRGAIRKRRHAAAGH